MLAAMLLAAALSEWVPMRWISASPDSLRLLDNSPVNCLLLEEEQWSPKLIEAATARGVATLAVVRREEQAGHALALSVTGIALEGSFPREWVKKLHGLVVELPPRRGIRFESGAGIAGTVQGVWPGIELEHPGPKSSTAAPTGSAWINTNSGFLRFARSATSDAFWIANQPPAGREFTAARYEQAIADAESVGARWVIALDRKLAERLVAGDPGARKDWDRIQTSLEFYEQHKEWRLWRPRAQLALVQDAASGGLITGNLLDMLAVMHTPVRAVPSRELDASQLDDTRVAVTIDPRAYTAEQRALIERFASKGGTVIAGPNGWHMPEPDGTRITFNKEEYRQLEAIWPELHLAIQRKNFGVRLFNVTGTLSYLVRSPDGKQTILHLVNYTDFPVESITAFVQGKFQKATLLSPGAPPRSLPIYDAPDGTGVEIDRLGIFAAILLE